MATIFGQVDVEKLTPSEVRKLLASLNKKQKKIEQNYDSQYLAFKSFLNESWASETFDISLFTEGKFTLTYSPTDGFGTLSWTPGLTKEEKVTKGEGRFNWSKILIQWTYANNKKENQVIPIKGEKSVDWDNLVDTLDLDESLAKAVKKISSSKDRVEFLKTIPGCAIINLAPSTPAVNGVEFSTPEYINGILENHNPVEKSEGDSPMNTEELEINLNN